VAVLKRSAANMAPVDHKSCREIKEYGGEKSQNCRCWFNITALDLVKAQGSIFRRFPSTSGIYYCAIVRRRSYDRHVNTCAR
jgi:hypothetical protein